MTFGCVKVFQPCLFSFVESQAEFSGGAAEGISLKEFLERFAED